MRLVRAERPEVASASLDREVAALAARQHGVVARDQLRALGLSDSAVSPSIAAGRLHVRHRGVYAVGHTVLTVRGHWMAAVLAAGPHAVLSHAAAGALWGLRSSGAVIADVTVPGTGAAPSARACGSTAPAT
jgi:hypothetical protein